MKASGKRSVDSSPEVDIRKRRLRDEVQVKKSVWEYTQKCRGFLLKMISNRYGVDLEICQQDGENLLIGVVSTTSTGYPVDAAVDEVKKLCSNMEANTVMVVVEDHSSDPRVLAQYVNEISGMFFNLLVELNTKKKRVYLFGKREIAKEAETDLRNMIQPGVKFTASVPEIKPAYTAPASASASQNGSYYPQSVYEETVPTNVATRPKTSGPREKKPQKQKQRSSRTSAHTEPLPAPGRDDSPPRFLSHMIDSEPHVARHEASCASTVDSPPNIENKLTKRQRKRQREKQKKGNAHNRNNDQCQETELPENSETGTKFSSFIGCIMGYIFRRRNLYFTFGLILTTFGCAYVYNSCPMFPESMLTHISGISLDSDHESNSDVEDSMSNTISTFELENLEERKDTKLNEQCIVTFEQTSAMSEARKEITENSSTDNDSSPPKNSRVKPGDNREVKEDKENQSEVTAAGNGEDRKNQSEVTAVGNGEDRKKQENQPEVTAAGNGEDINKQENQPEVTAAGNGEDRKNQSEVTAAGNGEDRKNQPEVTAAGNGEDINKQENQPEDTPAGNGEDINKQENQPEVTAAGNGEDINEQENQPEVTAAGNVEDINKQENQPDHP